MINIVIPMAGKGSRFSNAGYQIPKPLIEINGNSMIELVTYNITPQKEHRFIYLCLQEHLKKYNLEKKLKALEKNCIIIAVSEVTEGPACTVLLAEEYINNNEELMIANSDQYIDIDINKYLQNINKKDGLIMTMYAKDSKWSFIQYNEKREVTLVKEKEVISEEATVGIYNFTRGKDYVKYSKQMIEKNKRVNGEFYVAPVYNEMIKAKKSIGFYNIGSEERGMYGLGTPEDLNKFLHSPVSKTIFHITKG